MLEVGGEDQGQGLGRKRAPKGWEQWRWEGSVSTEIFEVKSVFTHGASCRSILSFEIFKIMKY